MNNKPTRGQYSQLTPRKIAAVLAAVSAALIICIVYFNYRTNQIAATISLADEPFLTAEERRLEITYLVQVSGEVLSPGVFEVPPGTRVMDVLELAGGASYYSNLDQLNLVGFVRDGQRINVPRVANVLDRIDILAQNGDIENIDRININTADQDELMRLPGVGPQTASNITAFRRANGPFESIEGIMDVHGIGEGTFSRISMFITIGAEIETEE
ncbi:MAG: helix-hairpin-helix domain-containing protein [Defluviitaleaceae bacterium]|nr:helix-hairpin-helix domain-containing protein [Defluviitaleaceae bacterium]